MTKGNNFYLSIINSLKVSTNLTKIRNNLNISRQQLNYYLRQLKKQGYIIQKGKGWYEVSKKCKNMTNHDNHLPKDSTRGHAYVWKIKLPKEIKDWNKRIKILKKKRINFNLIGAKGNTPRIKILGRKVWLCNDNLRVFDKPRESYYGKNAIESRNSALNEIKLIVGILERKLGVSIKPTDISFQKEHYALIKNDLAIEENKRGNIIRISDESGEWLLMDDSLEKGGELENIGKKAFKTNVPMQKWWNDHKEQDFKVTPSFILESLNKSIQVQGMHSQNIIKHQKVLDEMLKTLKKIQKGIK